MPTCLKHPGFYPVRPVSSLTIWGLLTTGWRQTRQRAAIVCYLCGLTPYQALRVLLLFVLLVLGQAMMPSPVGAVRFTHLACTMLRRRQDDPLRIGMVQPGRRAKRAMRQLHWIPTELRPDNENYRVVAQGQKRFGRRG